VKKKLKVKRTLKTNPKAKITLKAKKVNKTMNPKKNWLSLCLPRPCQREWMP
jgi:hypothetical protein